MAAGGLLALAGVKAWAEAGGASGTARTPAGGQRREPAQPSSEVRSVASNP